MDDDSDSDVIPLFPDVPDEESASAGWDPYIFSIVADSNGRFRKDRRRAPRVNTPTGRRALLLAKGRRDKDR